MNVNCEFDIEESIHVDADVVFDDNIDIVVVGLQEQLPLRGGQEEPDRLQGLQAEEVPHGRHVKVGIKVKDSQFKYVVIFTNLMTNNANNVSLNIRIDQ